MGDIEKVMKDNYKKVCQPKNDFNEIALHLDIEKNSKNLQFNLIKKIIYVTMLLFCFTLGFQFSNSINDAGDSNYSNKLHERLMMYSDDFLDTPILSTILGDEMLLNVYIGINSDDEVVFMVNFLTNNEEDKLEININGDLHTFVKKDYSHKDENLWDYFIVPSDDALEIFITYTNWWNEEFEKKFVINVNEYVMYLTK